MKQRQDKHNTKNNETKQLFFEKVNKVDKSLAKLIKRKKKAMWIKAQVVKRTSRHMSMEPRRSLENT